MRILFLGFKKQTLEGLNIMKILYNIFYDDDSGDGKYHVATTNDLKRWLVEHNSEREKGDQEKIDDFVIEETTDNYIY